MMNDMKRRGGISNKMVLDNNFKTLNHPNCILNISFIKFRAFKEIDDNRTKDANFPEFSQFLQKLFTSLIIFCFNSF